MTVDGTPEDDLAAETAAALAALAVVAAAHAASWDVTRGAGQRPRPLWSDPAHGFRRPGAPGPGAWRAPAAGRGLP